jgi:hypothetical protein
MGTPWRICCCFIHNRPPLCLAADPEVPGSIPGASRFSERQRVWNGVHSASWVLVSVTEETLKLLDLSSSEFGYQARQYGVQVRLLWRNECWVASVTVSGHSHVNNRVNVITFVVSAARSGLFHRPLCNNTVRVTRGAFLVYKADISQFQEVISADRKSPCPVGTHRTAESYGLR